MLCGRFLATPGHIFQDFRLGRQQMSYSISTIAAMTLRQHSVVFR